jgi:hypothetical protein
MKEPLNHFRNFTVKDFDRYDCLKPPWLLYLVLAYLLRGYLIFIFSVANLSDKTAILTSIYPQPESLYFSLLAGLPALLFMLIIAGRTPEAPRWLKIGWHYGKQCLTFAIAVNLFIELFGYFSLEQTSSKPLLIHLFCSLLGVLFVIKSTRLKLALADFPVKLEQN